MSLKTCKYNEYTRKRLFFMEKSKSNKIRGSCIECFTDYLSLLSIVSPYKSAIFSSFEKFCNIKNKILQIGINQPTEYLGSAKRL